MKSPSCLVKAVYICVSYASSTYNTLRNFRRCRVRRLFLYCFHYVHARWPVISFHGQGNYSLLHRVVALTAPAAAAAAASVPGELLRSRLSTTRHVYNTPTENAGLLFSRSSFLSGDENIHCRRRKIGSTLANTGAVKRKRMNIYVKNKACRHKRKISATRIYAFEQCASQWNVDEIGVLRSYGAVVIFLNNKIRSSQYMCYFVRRKSHFCYFFTIAYRRFEIAITVLVTTSACVLCHSASLMTTACRASTSNLRSPSHVTSRACALLYFRRLRDTCKRKRHQRLTGTVGWTQRGRPAFETVKSTTSATPEGNTGQCRFDDSVKAWMIEAHRNSKSCRLLRRI